MVTASLEYESMDLVGLHASAELIIDVTKKSVVPHRKSSDTKAAGTIGSAGKISIKETTLLASE